MFAAVAVQCQLTSPQSRITDRYGADLPDWDAPFIIFVDQVSLVFESDRGCPDKAFPGHVGDEGDRR